MDLKEKLIAHFSQFEQSLNGQAKASLHSVRKQALQQFEALGFPTVKHEEWKYTSLAPISRGNYDLDSNCGTVTAEAMSKYTLDAETYKVVFVDGCFSESLSDLKGANFTIMPFWEAVEKEADLVNQYFGTIAPWKDDALVALNTAFANRGSFIHVAKNTVVDRPVQLLYLSSEGSQGNMHQYRNLVILEEGAEARFFERHQSLASNNTFSNVVTEAHIKSRAIFDWYKVQNDDLSAALIDNTWVAQEAQSVATVDTFSFGGKFTRNNLSFLHKGEHIESNMNGVTIIGKDQLVDHHTLVDHAQPNCNSNQLYKGIYDENAKGVFNGKVMVHCEAQKTNAFQQNNNILLDDAASIDTKPQLEIFADDVKCSHGCTIGQHDDDALFYLRSRGIAKKDAQAMLTYAFCMDALSEIKIPELKDKLNRVLAMRLGVELDFDL